MSIDAPSWSGDAFDVMRIGVGFTVLLAANKMQFFRPSGTPSDPLGIARFIPLGWLSSQRTARRMRNGMYVALLCYVADVLVPYALLYLMSRFSSGDLPSVVRFRQRRHLLALAGGNPRL